jgi:hypothetical protein
VIFGATTGWGDWFTRRHLLWCERSLIIVRTTLTGGLLAGRGIEAELLDGPVTDVAAAAETLLALHPDNRSIRVTDVLAARFHRGITASSLRLLLVSGERLKFLWSARCGVVAQDVVESAPFSRLVERLHSILGERIELV